ncbi:lipase family protein [Bacteroidota bacterium]
MKKHLVPLIILLFLLASCEKEEQEIAERGYVIATKQIRIYSTEEIKANLVSRKFELPFTLEHEVKAVKIAYMTPDPYGKLVNATGAVFIPETTGEFPIICFQHGTQTQRHLVPSLGAGNSDAGLAGSVAASMGYICVAADYLGLGESYIVPPYLLAENSATTVIDMLRASKKYFSEQGVQTDGSLYLTGYSQGGYVTMATHHEIEKNYSDEFTVTASAPMAGPYDLSGIFDTILTWETYKQPILMAFLMNSYHTYYDWNRLSEVFHEPYAGNIPDFFDGSQMMSTINLGLPQTLDSLLLESFINDYTSGKEEELRQAVQDNSLLTYVPAAPVRLIHGDADKTVPYFNSIAARDYYENGGKTNIELITVPGDHEGAAEAAIVGAMQWIESLRNK